MRSTTVLVLLGFSVSLILGAPVQPRSSLTNSLGTRFFDDFAKSGRLSLFPAIHEEPYMRRRNEMSAPRDATERLNLHVRRGISHTNEIIIGASIGGAVFLLLLLAGVILFTVRRRIRAENATIEKGFVPTVYERRSTIDPVSTPLMGELSRATTAVEDRSPRSPRHPDHGASQDDPTNETRVPLLGHTAAPVEERLTYSSTPAITAQERERPSEDEERLSISEPVTRPLSRGSLHERLTNRAPSSPEMPKMAGVGVERSASTVSTVSELSPLPSASASLKGSSSNGRSSLPIEAPGRPRSASVNRPSMDRARPSMDKGRPTLDRVNTGPGQGNRSRSSSVNNTSPGLPPGHRRITSQGSYVESRPTWSSEKSGSTRPRGESISKGDPIYAPYRRQ